MIHVHVIIIPIICRTDLHRYESSSAPSSTSMFSVHASRGSVAFVVGFSQYDFRNPIFPGTGGLPVSGVNATAGESAVTTVAGPGCGVPVTPARKSPTRCWLVPPRAGVCSGDRLASRIC